MSTGEPGAKPRFERRAWPKLCKLIADRQKAKAENQPTEGLDVIARYLRVFKEESLEPIAVAFEQFEPTEEEWAVLAQLERDVRQALEPNARRGRIEALERLRQIFNLDGAGFGAVQFLIREYAKALRSPEEAAIFDFAPTEGIALDWPLSAQDLHEAERTLNAGYPVTLLRHAEEVEVETCKRPKKSKPTVVSEENQQVPAPTAAPSPVLAEEEKTTCAPAAIEAEAAGSCVSTEKSQSCETVHTSLLAKELAELADKLPPHVQANLCLNRWPTLARYTEEAMILIPEKPAQELANIEAEAERLCLEAHATARQKAEAKDGVILACESPNTDGHPGLITFLVCPPGVDLPRLPVGFQASRDPEATLAAVETLLQHPEIAVFMFSESGRKRRSPLGARKGPFWRAAGLICEWLAHRLTKKAAKSSFRVHLYLAETQGVPAGSSVAPKFFEQLRHTGPFKEKGVQLNGLHVLAQDEHGWLGYADALSFLGRCTWSPKAEKVRLKLLEREDTLELPFDSFILDELRALLHRTGQPDLDFLMAVCKLTNRYAALISDMLSPAIRRAILSLDTEEWATLCEECRASLLRDTSCSRAIGALVDAIEACPEPLEALFGPVAFDYLDTALAIARIRHDLTLAEHVIGRWEQLREQEFEPLPEVEHIFEIRRADLDADRFAYASTLERVENRLKDEELDEDTATLLSICRAQALAYLEHPVLAISILDELPEGDEDLESHYLRLAHLWYDRARLNCDMEALSAAYDAAVYATGAQSRREVDVILQGAERQPQIAAALAKIWAAMPIEERPDFLPKLFEKEHLRRRPPFEGVAFWGAVLLSEQSDEVSQARARSLARFVLSLAHHSLQDAQAVRHMCYQRALRFIGLLRRGEPTLDLEGVLAVSTPDTKRWLNETYVRSPRSLMDCLAPLSFNLR